MTAATVDDLLTRELRDDRTALVDATGKPFDYHWLCTSAWKSGNFLRHSGVREGVTVGVVGDGPLALLAFFGTTLLEGTTRFDPPTDLADEDAFRTLVAPVDLLENGAYDLPRGAQKVGYGRKPDAPDVHHFDAGLWSENPAFPPLSIDPETAMLTDGDRTLTHADILQAARDVIDECGLEAEDRVVVRGPLSDLRTVVAGVIAPLLAEGVVVLGDGEDDDRGDAAVSGESVPEPVWIDLESVSF
ncbi:hypothetical protein [Natronobacterium gregoryi]|uniref:Acetyl-CoA synthetase n=2 Tax=Natronobacterium gregoryi TaxID=44930 RepID=L0ALB5_NATGS|nr:hypothetical protein [Natronobacterium gregoryi]AFZ74239.1 hypothetical protein Natgr_3107 [Natronobacterium gregoryi SP2]ELY63696.1 hypothetical protein C490_15639 [Natronobacterium gregoryi SP2]PLK21975.1 hypothetical protein CYV19_00830 [Natronobacterium gregoryi SP2]SFI52066.1 hypothetical protein SAMN05443661_101126 [Natronobacterium gregoryi]